MKTIVAMMVLMSCLAGMASANELIPPCDPGEPRVFNDVPTDHPLCGWIEELWRRGATVGCGDGNFCPDGSLTRGQSAPLILKSQQQAQDPWMKVSFLGDLLAGEGVEQVIHLTPGAGIYGIVFDRDVEDCAITGTVRDWQGFSTLTAIAHIRADLVTVSIYSDGERVDKPFDLILRCPQLEPPIVSSPVDTECPTGKQCY